MREKTKTVEEEGKREGRREKLKKDLSERRKCALLSPWQGDGIRQLFGTDDLVPRCVLARGKK